MIKDKYPIDNVAMESAARLLKRQFAQIGPCFTLYRKT